MTKLQVLRPRLATLDMRRVRPPAKQADPFYHSPEWRALIDQIIRQRGYRCEDPECPIPHPPVTRIFGDHIKELRDGGAPLDPTNVLLRCGSAHTRKTLRERAKRMELI